MTMCCRCAAMVDVLSSSSLRVQLLLVLWTGTVYEWVRTSGGGGGSVIAAASEVRLISAQCT